MATRKDLDEETNEEEANEALMASTYSDAKSKADSKDKDEVFFLTLS